MTPKRSLQFVLLAIGCAGVAGCQPADWARSGGKVMYDGQPVEKGVIVFRPLDRGSAPEAAPIEAGSFTIEGRAGKRRVEIRGTRPIDDAKLPKTMPRLEGVPLFEDYIPAIHNADSTLEVEVAPGDRNVFDFNLTPPPLTP